MSEYLLLSILLYKASFTAFQDEVDRKTFKDTYRELNYVLDVIYELHEKVVHDLTVDDVAAMFWAKYPDSDKEIYGPIFEELRGIKISEDSASVVIAEYKTRAKALAISEAAFKVSQNGGDLSAVKSLMEDLTAVNSTEDLGVNLVSDDLESLVAKTYNAQGLSWPLDCLNKSLGPLRMGDFGFVFARPETGKTSLLAQWAAHWLKNHEAVIAWMNNEEQDYKVKLRVYTSYFAVPVQQILANIKKYQQKFNEETKGRFLLFDAARIHHRAVEKVVARYSPNVVIYDQLTKLDGFKADRDDLELGHKFQWARELAKNNHAAIGVSQADGSAEGVRYLTMQHVANAKTAVQAEADFILGVGKDANPSNADTRYLALSKNKLLGSKDTKEELRHGRFEVGFDHVIAKYKDLIRFD